MIQSAAFWKFWRQYQPYSARVHAINKGELGLSQCLRRERFVCDPAYSSVRLAAALATEPLTLEEVSELTPFSDNWDVSTGKVFNSVIQLEHTPTESPVASTESEAPAWSSELSNISDDTRERMEKQLSKYWAFWLAQQFEAANPTHSSALICNRLFIAPIKRDVCFRGVLGIHQLLRYASGFDSDELAAMHRDLRTRSLGWRMSGVQRILFSKGRL